MSVQQEVLLWTMNDKGEKVPYACEDCGRQRVGVILNIVTKTMLSCPCSNPCKKVKMPWDLSDVEPG